MNRKKFLLGCAGLALLLCSVCGGFVYYKLEIEYPTDPFSVGVRFLSAMQDGNTSRAREIVIPSQWHRIDEWMTRHTPVRCPFSLDPDSGNFFSVGDGQSWYIVGRCYPYEIWVDGIRFDTKDVRLQVTTWERICDQDDTCEPE